MRRGAARSSTSPGSWSCTRPFPEHAGRVLERSRWVEVPCGVLRSLSRACGVRETGRDLRAAGGVVIYGRSDTTLNPGGVRIGTAEIYRQVEQLPEIVESVVVGT